MAQQNAQIYAGAPLYYQMPTNALHYQQQHQQQLSALEVNFVQAKRELNSDQTS
jgi:hypothetical protein